MKKILVTTFLLVFGLCLFVCAGKNNRPHITVPYGLYDNNLLIS